MRYWVVIAFITLVSCKKEDSLQFPVHTNSFDWVMTGSPFIYLNATGDTLTSSNVDVFSAYDGENASFPQASGYEIQPERYIKTISIDSFLTYKTTLVAEVLDGKRNDALFIEFENTAAPASVSYSGIAEPEHFINTSADPLVEFTDSVRLNNELYNNVYIARSSDMSLYTFISRSGGLIGFTLESDTFNLDN